ncbi:hypothetical protein ACFSFY_14505 [Sporosarcina siberiensis]|uniref:Fur-regulated basic protein A n=1 Tax=Sporosarcina siberiensis TaxID=1365606 RepID=A0ABW4SIJ7_9BACL
MVEMTSDGFEVGHNDLELFELKKELLEFVVKMKSEGFLSSVDYDDLPEL